MKLSRLITLRGLLIAGAAVLSWMPFHAASADEATATSAVNVRSEAQAGSKIVVVLKRGESVEVLDTSGEYSQVKTTSGKVGYLKTKYLNVSESMAQTPAPAAPVMAAPVVVAQETTSETTTQTTTQTTTETAPAPSAPASADDGVARLDEVQVTGTRIKAPGLVASSPVASYSAEEIQLTQAVTVEDFIKNLPGAVPSVGPGTNNGTDGGATLDLRGLGANRTLVLVNGRRLVPFDLEGVVDTNSIPIELIERIDLVTGGASAVYGADAVAGVVNVILKRNFTGASFSTQYGKSSEKDGRRQRSDMILGADLADGRGNVLFSLGHTRTAPVLQGNRPFGVASISSTTGNPQGSGTTVPAQIFNNTGAANTGGQVQPNGTIGAPVATFNFNPLNYYQTALDRTQATALGRFNLADSHEVYSELLYVRSDVTSNVAPSGTFFNDYGVPVGNPFIPEPARQQLCMDAGIAPAACVAGNPQELLLTIGRRFVEFGPRLDNFENKTFQGTLGFRGTIGSSAWTYDAYWSHGESDRTETLVNWGSNSKVQQALRALTVDTCIDPSNGCVPLNVFGASGTITPAMIRFVTLDAIQTQFVEQDVYSGSISGDLGRSFLPWTSRPIGLAGGLEYRELTGGNKSDSASQIQGEVLGTGAPTPDRLGVIELREAFGELFLPIAENLPGVYSASLEAGIRYTEFSTATSETDYETYKFGGEYAPVKSLRFRGLAQRATRAPNINELFQPLITGLDNLAVDPCEGANTNMAEANTPGTLSNLCRQTGVPVSQLGRLPAPSAGQINVQQGGNPNLGPEVADTLTFGFVWEPEFVKNLSLTLDYYDIEIEDAVSSKSSTDVLTACYSAAANPGRTFNADCALVGRNPNNGSFNGTNAPGLLLALSNLGTIKTDGIDLGVNYRMGLEQYGALRFALNATKVLNSEFQATATSVNRDCLGFYSVACNNQIDGTAIVHEYKANFRTTWTLNAFDASLNWRYLHGLEEEPGGQVFFPAFQQIDSYHYFDLSGAWRVTDSITLSASVDNLLDKEPPQVGNTIGGTAANSGNTFPQYYDTIGRFYTVGAAITFQ